MNKADTTGETPLLLAVKSGNLLKKNEHKKCLYSFEKYFYNFLGQNDMVEYLMSMGANVSLGNNDGVTPLHSAAEKGWS